MKKAIAIAALALMGSQANALHTTQGYAGYWFGQPLIGGYLFPRGLDREIKYDAEKQRLKYIVRQSFCVGDDRYNLKYKFVRDLPGYVWEPKEPKAEVITDGCI